MTKIENENIFYSYLRASTGFNLDACTAGYTPKNMPTITETVKPTITEVDVTAVNKKLPASRAPRIPKAIPIKPPKSVMTTDSAKNWRRISLELAPIAFLMPISLVLSATVASIIFIMPMPPTIRATSPIRVSAVVRADVATLARFSNWAMSDMVKFSTPCLVVKSVFTTAIRTFFDIFCGGFTNIAAIESLLVCAIIFETGI